MTFASGVSRWELPSNRMAVHLAVLRVRDYLNRESPHDARTCGISRSRKCALASPGERPGQTRSIRCKSLRHGPRKDDIRGIPHVSSGVAFGPHPQTPEGRWIRRDDDPAGLRGRDGPGRRRLRRDRTGGLDDARDQCGAVRKKEVGLLRPGTGMREGSVDFIIRPWGIPPEKRGPFEWKRVGEWYIALDGRGRVRVLLPAIFIALEKERKSKNLPGPVPEVQLLDQIVYVTGHE